MSEAARTRLDIDARGVATLTLARPAAHNALDARMIDEITAAAGRLAETTGTRALVIAAEGRSFCAGADLAWMRAQIEADRADRLAEARRLAAMLQAVDHLGMPVIAKVQGAALGGGVGLVAVADIAIAAEGALFALTETRLGLIPATIAPYLVARLGARARGAMLTARRFSAAEAVGIGLVAASVPAERLDAALETEIAAILQTAPGAGAAAKALFHRLHAAVDEAAVDASVTALADAWERAEAAEGIAAFFAKRPAPWVS